MDGFWIGSGDPGLFYYSFEDKALHSVENLPAQPTEIHGIYEENDSVLYVVTAGSGFHKLILEKQAGTIRFKSQKSYHFFSRSAGNYDVLSNAARGGFYFVAWQSGERTRTV